MTKEQFGEHIRRVLWGLSRFERVLPEKLAPLEADCGANAPLLRRVICRGSAQEDSYVKVSLANTEVKRLAKLTEGSLYLGADWRQIVAAQNTAEVIRRVQKMPPDRGKAWYSAIANAVSAGFTATDQVLDQQLAIAQAELEYWETVLAITSAPVRVIQAGAEAGAELVGGAASGLLSGLFKGLGPILFTVALIAGGYVVYRVVAK